MVSEKIRSHILGLVQPNFRRSARSLRLEPQRRELLTADASKQSRRESRKDRLLKIGPMSLPNPAARHLLRLGNLVLGEMFRSIVAQVDGGFEPRAAAMSHH